MPPAEKREVFKIAPGDVYVLYLGNLAKGSAGWLVAGWLGIIAVVVAGSSNLYYVSQRWGPRLIEHPLARAFHLGRSGAVRSVQVRSRNAEVELQLHPKRNTGVDLELWAIEKEKSYFREVLGRALSAAAA